MATKVKSNTPKETKIVVVLNKMIISELGGVQGPIASPRRIDVDKIERMVMHGKNVYECDPKNPSRRIRLNKFNMNLNNFGGTADSTSSETKVENENKSKKNKKKDEKKEETTTTSAVIELSNGSTSTVEVEEKKDDIFGSDFLSK